MRDDWKKQDRTCLPCANCGTELYEQFWGNGGWITVDKATGHTHGDRDCVRVLRARLPQEELREIDVGEVVTAFRRLLTVYENENETTDDTGVSRRPSWIYLAVAAADRLRP